MGSGRTTNEPNECYHHARGDCGGSDPDHEVMHLPDGEERSEVRTMSPHDRNSLARACSRDGLGDL